jgi:hypothetical protein
MPHIGGESVESDATAVPLRKSIDRSACDNRCSRPSVNPRLPRDAAGRENRVRARYERAEKASALLRRATKQENGRDPSGRGEGTRRSKREQKRREKKKNTSRRARVREGRRERGRDDVRACRSRSVPASLAVHWTPFGLFLLARK